MSFLIDEMKMSSSSTSGFEGIPLQLSKHFGNARFTGVIVGNKSCSTSLDFFNGVFI